MAEKNAPTDRPRSAHDYARPYRGAFSITPAAAALARPITGLYVGGSGNVTVTMLSGESVELVGLAAGEIHRLEVTHVTAATATGIVGLY